MHNSAGQSSSIIVKAQVGVIPALCRLFQVQVPDLQKRLAAHDVWLERSRCLCVFYLADQGSKEDYMPYEELEFLHLDHREEMIGSLETVRDTSRSIKELLKPRKMSTNEDKVHGSPSTLDAKEDKDGKNLGGKPHLQNPFLFYGAVDLTMLNEDKHYKVSIQVQLKEPQPECTTDIRVIAQVRTVKEPVYKQNIATIDRNGQWNAAVTPIIQASRFGLPLESLEFLLTKTSDETQEIDLRIGTIEFIQVPCPCDG